MSLATTVADAIKKVNDLMDLVKGQYNKWDGQVKAKIAELESWKSGLSDRVRISQYDFSQSTGRYTNSNGNTSYYAKPIKIGTFRKTTGRSNWTLQLASDTNYGNQWAKAEMTISIYSGITINLYILNVSDTKSLNFIVDKDFNLWVLPFGIWDSRSELQISRDRHIIDLDLSQYGDYDGVNWVGVPAEVKPPSDKEWAYAFTVEPSSSYYFRARFDDIETAVLTDKA